MPSTYYITSFLRDNAKCELRVRMVDNHVHAEVVRTHTGQEEVQTLLERDVAVDRRNTVGTIDLALHKALDMLDSDCAIR